MRSQRQLVTDRAVMLALAGTPTAKAISQAMWEHGKPNPKPRDHEENIAELLALSAAINSAKAHRAIDRQLVASATLPEFVGLPTRTLSLPPELPPALPHLDREAVRGLFNAPHHTTGRAGAQKPKVYLDARIVLFVLMCRLEALTRPQRPVQARPAPHRGISTDAAQALAATLNARRL